MTGKFKITICYTDGTRSETFTDESSKFEKWLCSDNPIYCFSGSSKIYVLKQNICFVKVDEIN